MTYSTDTLALLITPSRSRYLFLPHPQGPKRLQQHVTQLRKQWQGAGITGRVLLAPEGVNGFVAVPTSRVPIFLNEVEERFGAGGRSGGPPLTMVQMPDAPGIRAVQDGPGVGCPAAGVSSVPGDSAGDDAHGVTHGSAAVGAELPTFRELRVKQRPHLVADLQPGLDAWLEDCGNEITPEEWHRKLLSATGSASNATATATTPAATEPVVIDVRNHFEQMIGRFDNAVRVNGAQPSQQPASPPLPPLL